MSPNETPLASHNQALFSISWPKPLMEGRFIKRYKRFFVDVSLNDQVVTCHLPNTGSLLGLLNAGAPVLIMPKEPRKDGGLPWSLKAIQCLETQTWVGVDTGVPSHLLKNLASSSWLNRLWGVDNFALEKKINTQTRLDGWFRKSEGKEGFIELKNVTLAQYDTARRAWRAFFPDAVTTRGQKHLEELILLKNQGYESRLVFVIQRSDIDEFAPAEFIDHRYAELLKQAKHSGVIIEAWKCAVTPSNVAVIDWNVPLYL